VTGDLILAPFDAIILLADPIRASTPTITGVSNAAGAQTGVSSGAFVSIYGSNFTPLAYDDWGKSIFKGQLPIQLDAISVSTRHGVNFTELLRLLKRWQISYARHHGFKRIVTNTCQSNQRIIALNRKHGFKVIRTTPGYYCDPPEPVVVMELNLRPSVLSQKFA
jgi:hypothetical protein